jgi:hypothetical protein
MKIRANIVDHQICLLTCHLINQGLLNEICGMIDVYTTTLPQCYSIDLNLWHTNNRGKHLDWDIKQQIVYG